MVAESRKAAGIVLLMAALVLCGGIVIYHCLPNQSVQNANPLEEDTKPDVKKYGSEGDARRYAEQVIQVRLDMIQNLDEAVRWSLQFWSEPASKRYSERIPHSQVKEVRQGDKEGFARTLGTLDAKLDQETGLWTVTGVSEFGGPAPQAAWEVDWKLIVRYTPSTGRWDVVGGEWNGLEKVAAGSFCLEGFMNPARHGWRPVGRKDSRSTGR